MTHYISEDKNQFIDDYLGDFNVNLTLNSLHDETPFLLVNRCLLIFRPAYFHFENETALLSAVKYTRELNLDENSFPLFFIIVSLNIHTVFVYDAQDYWIYLSAIKPDYQDFELKKIPTVIRLNVGKLKLKKIIEKLT